MKVNQKSNYFLYRLQHCYQKAELRRVRRNNSKEKQVILNLFVSANKKKREKFME